MNLLNPDESWTHSPLAHSFTQDSPQEADIGFTVMKTLKDNKREFYGKNALLEIKKNGLQRKLICLTINKEYGPLFGNETIYRNGIICGIIRSTAFGYSINKTISYGYCELKKLG